MKHIARGGKLCTVFHKDQYWDLYYLTFTLTIYSYFHKVLVWLTMLTIAPPPPYEFSGSIDEVIQKLEHDSRILMGWYEMNYLQPNPDKWHLLLSDTGEDIFLSIEGKVISNIVDEKILGVYFDNKLNFKTHITKLCKKASQKLHALARLSNVMSCQQRNIIMNAFISSQFNYCPLIWMCHSRSLHTQINKILERALRIVHKDGTSFEQLLQLSGSIKIHHRNLQLLSIEIF